MKAKNQKSKSISTYDEHLDNRYGQIGTAKRTDFEIKAKAFAIGEVIKEERRLASMTQEQLAEKTGTKKSFIFMFSFRLIVESDFSFCKLIFSNFTNWLHGPFSSKKIAIFGMAKTGIPFVPITSLPKCISPV